MTISPILLPLLGVLSAPPEMRHLNYVAISAPRGAMLRCEARCVAHGFRNYRSRLRCRLVSRDGHVILDQWVDPGARRQLSAKVTWEGRCALESNSGQNLAQMDLADTPHAYLGQVGRPFKTVRAWGPLYFFVPKGTRYFNIWIQASVPGEGLHYTLRDPSGRAVRDEGGDFNPRTKVQIALRKDRKRDGAAWSIEISKPLGKGLVLDDVSVELGRHLPPFLAPKPEWATQFAGHWRYDPKAPRPTTKLVKQALKLKPFTGVKDRAVDAAYDRDASRVWKSTLPFTYVLDYGSRHLGHPKYIPAVATAPPVLLHLGKDVALNHGWGPVKALGGENQAWGKGDAVTRLSPEQVRERIDGLRRMADGLHTAGVRWVMPYICAMTVNGNDKERAGFWDFYDHWDAYRALGLGPKPPTDPREWLQRNPDGSPRIYYGYKGDHYPRFDRHNHRYAASWHSAGFRTWMREVVRFLAKCGFDGCFVDNACSQRTLGPRSLAAFREYWKQDLSAQQARRLFGDLDLGAVQFPKKPDTPIYAAMHRFWCKTIRDEMATIKRVGTEALGREFAVFPNGGRPSFIQRALMDTDFVMFEKSHGEYGTHPGLVLSPVFEGVKLRAYNDNIFEYKFVQCLRRRVRPMILSRAGWPRRLPWLVMNRNTARLGMAECGAFSGGGGFLLRPRFDLFADALNAYRRFFETHADLFAGMDTYAQVAVLACPEQSWYGNTEHIHAVRTLTQSLAREHVLFDYVPESLLTAQTLQRYTTVIAPELHYVSDAQMDALERYVRAGGRLVAAGAFATHDDAMRERPAKGALKPQARFQTCEQAAGALAKQASIMRPIADAAQTHVAVNAWRGADRIVLHLVNYNVPLGAAPGPPVEVKGIEVDLPLPPGVRVAKATCYAPDENEPKVLSVTSDGRHVRFSVPALRIYQVVLIEWP
jgi:glycosyl hydrolase family 42 (putative beta-galactosidase)